MNFIQPGSHSNPVFSAKTLKRDFFVQFNNFLINYLKKKTNYFTILWTEQICLSRHCQSGLQANALKVALIIIWCITTNEGNFKIIKINYCSSNDSPATDAFLHYIFAFPRHYLLHVFYFNQAAGTLITVKFSIIINTIIVILTSSALQTKMNTECNAG